MFPELDTHVSSEEYKLSGILLHFHIANVGYNANSSSAVVTINNILIFYLKNITAYKGSPLILPRILYLMLF